MSKVQREWSQANVEAIFPHFIRGLKQGSMQLDNEEERLLKKREAEGRLSLELIEIWILQANDAAIQGRLLDQKTILQKARDGITGRLGRVEHCKTNVKKAKFLNLRNQIFLLLGEKLPVQKKPCKFRELTPFSPRLVGGYGRPPAPSWTVRG